MSMLRLCKKFPPKARQSTGVNTAWIHPIKGEKKQKRVTLLYLTFIKTKYIIYHLTEEANKQKTQWNLPVGMNKVFPCLTEHL